MRTPTEDEVAMAEALKASEARNQMLLDQARDFDTSGHLRYFLASLFITLGMVWVLVVPSQPPPISTSTSQPIVIPPPVPGVELSFRRWNLVHGVDDIHVEDGTGEVVVEFEHLARLLEVPADMERLSGRQMRRVLWFAQDLVDAHNQSLE